MQYEDMTFLYILSSFVKLSPFKYVAYFHIFSYKVLHFLCITYNTESFQKYFKNFNWKVKHSIKKLRNISATFQRQLWNSKMFAIPTHNILLKGYLNVTEKICNLLEILSKSYGNSWNLFKILLTIILSIWIYLNKVG